MSHRVVLAGTRQILLQGLNVLFQLNIYPHAVYTSPENEQSIRSFVCERKIQQRFDIKTTHIRNDYEYLSKINPTHLFSLQYCYRVDKQTLNLFKGNAFNLHFSLLPKYGGCYPITWAILNGEAKTGVTLHEMTEAFDDGDIIAQSEVVIPPNINAGELYEMETEAASQLFSQWLPGLLRGNVKRFPQSKIEFKYYTKDSIDWHRDFYVIWEREVSQIHNQIRAFTFPQFQLPKTFLNGNEVGIAGSEIKDYEILKDAKLRLLAQPKAFSNNQLIGIYDQKAVVWKESGLLLLASFDNSTAEQFLARKNLKFNEELYFHTNADKKRVLL